MAKTIVTHGGTFHPDDIFAVATLLLIYPDSKIVRTRDQKLIEVADIAIDIGSIYDPKLLRFDHHQKEGAGVRENGIPYASFGLVWNEFGEWITGSREGKEIIEEKLVMPIDAIDNGVAVSVPIFSSVKEYTITDILYSFHESKEGDETHLYETFLTLVEVAKNLITREVRRTSEKIRLIEKVRRAIRAVEDKRIIVLPDELPWERVIVPIEEARFVVFPNKEKRWAVKAVPTTVHGFERRIYFPDEWAGKEGKELASLTGIEGAYFCHRGCFYMSASTKEAALALAEKALHSYS